MTDIFSLKYAFSCSTSYGAYKNTSIFLTVYDCAGKEDLRTTTHIPENIKQQ